MKTPSIIDTIEAIVMSRQVIDDGNGMHALKLDIEAIERAPEEALEAIRQWRASTPDAEKYWPRMLGGLLYTPHAVAPLSDAFLDALVSLDVDDPRPLALRRLPAGLASTFDAEVALARMERGLSELQSEPHVEARIEGLASLAEHALGAFDQSVRPETKVAYKQHWMRALKDSMRAPLATLLDRILQGTEASHSDRGALFLRLWTWLRQGWLDELRYIKTLPHSPEPLGDWSLRLARLPGSDDAVRAVVRQLQQETKTVQASPTFRPLLFALLTQLDDAEAMRAALPAGPQWAHHKAITSAFEKRGQAADAIAYLKTLRASVERDDALARLLRADATEDEAFASERPHPSNLDALMARYKKTKSELIDVGIERMRKTEVRDWLDHLVLHQDWKRALLLVKQANAEDVLRLLDTSLPSAASYDLARTALEHAFDARAVWPDAARAKEVIGMLLTKTLQFAPDAKARAKVRKQTRTRTQKVITKGTDFFTRELAFALEDALDKHEES